MTLASPAFFPAIDKDGWASQGNLQNTLKIMAKKNDTKNKPEVPAKAEAPVKPAALAKAAAPAKTPVPAKRASKPAATKTKTVTAKAKLAPKAPVIKAAAYTRDDVALRAYFISEKRQGQGLPGDEHQDWIEAERQLAAESKLPRKLVKA